jgi:hypothetical protein
MTTLKTILTNEIKDVLGHEPSKIEFKSAMDYIEDNIDDKSALVDVEISLRNWKDDCLICCEVCGEYFLPEFMEEHFIGQGWQKVCSGECANELRQDWE